MAREVCGICWCPYDEFTGECACAPEPKEPVGWASKRTLDRIKDFDGTIYANGGFDDAVPLYTAPPQRKPLSEDEVLDIARTFGAQPWPPGSCVAFARAVEKAHGIGGKA